MPDPWILRKFAERLKEWREREHPPPSLVSLVFEWFPYVEADPFDLAQAVPGHGGKYWWVAVPGAVHDGLTVVCTYEIRRDSRDVICKEIGLRDDPPQAGH